MGEKDKLFGEEERKKDHLRYKEKNLPTFIIESIQSDLFPCQEKNFPERLTPRVTQRPIRKVVDCPLYRTEVSPDTCMACYYYQKPHDTENIFPFDMRKHLEQRTIPCSLPDLIPKRNTDHEIEDITGKYFRRETIPFIKKP